MPSTKEIEAGRAFVRLYLKNDMGQQLARALKSSGRNIMRFGAGVTAAGTAVVAPILAAAKAFATTGDSLDKMSARTGVAVEFLSSLGHAAELGGADMETMEKAIKKLQGSAYDASQGLSTQVDAFNDLGVSAQTVSGELKGTEALFMETVTALSKVENETKKAALAQRLFGRAGTQLLPMLKGGKEGLAAAMKEAKRLGYVLSAEDATAAAKLTDAMARLKSTLHATWIRVGGAVAEMLTTLANRMAETGVKAIDFVKTHKTLIQTLLKVGAVVIAAGAAITAFGATAWAMGAAITGATATVHGLTVTLGFLVAHPAILALGAITAATVALSLAMYRANKYTVDLSDKMTKLRNAGDEQRATNQAMIGRLEELSEVNRMTNTEMDEGESILAKLTERYGDLGVAVDRVAGKLGKMTEAQKAAMTAQDRAGAEAAIRQEIGESQSNISEMSEELKTLGSTFGMRANPVGVFRIIGGVLSGEKQRMEDLGVMLDQEQEKINVAIARLRGLKAGDKEAITGGAAAGGGNVPGAEATAEVAAFNKRMIDEISQLRIQGIEDEHRKAVALLEERYGKEKRKAQELGGSALALAEAAHKQALQNLESEAAKRKTLAQQAQAEERAMRERDFDQLLGSQEKSRQSTMGSIADQIARLEIKTGGGTDTQKQMQLLDLEHMQALTDASSQGMGLGDQERVNELYDLKRKEAGQGAGSSSGGATLTATYSAKAAQISGYGGGGSPEKQMASGIAATAKNTLQAATKAGEMAAALQQFLAAWRVG